MAADAHSLAKSSMSLSLSAKWTCGVYLLANSAPALLKRASYFPILLQAACLVLSDPFASFGQIAKGTIPLWAISRTRRRHYETASMTSAFCRVSPARDKKRGMHFFGENKKGLQRFAITLVACFCMVPRDRIELPTQGFSVPRSTN